MPIDEFIINIYLMVEQYYKIVVTKPLRSAGYAPKLSDPEIICMEMVGEFLNLDQDKQIWQYFTQHWQDWFPAIGSYPNFAISALSGSALIIRAMEFCKSRVFILCPLTLHRLMPRQCGTTPTRIQNRDCGRQALCRAYRASHEKPVDSNFRTMSNRRV